MTLRTKYSSKEIEVLESYSHRLNNKVHITFPGGTFGDMLWSSVFVTNTLSHINDISEVSPVTTEGRVETIYEVKDITHFAFKLGNAINDKLETRHDILFAVYMGINKSTLEDPIFELDDKNNDNRLYIIDVILTHCGDESRVGLMDLFETEFNQKLIFLLPNKTDAEFYGEICSRKTDINNEYDWIFTPSVSKITENITDNALVINPNRFVLDEETYIECVKEILDFIEMKVDTDTVNKIVSYRTVWYNNQPKYILDYDFSTF